MASCFVSVNPTVKLDWQTMIQSTGISALGNRLKFEERFLAISRPTGYTFEQCLPSPKSFFQHADAPDDRSFWLSILSKLADPVLENLSRGELEEEYAG